MQKLKSEIPTLLTNVSRLEDIRRKIVNGSLKLAHFTAKK